MSENDQEAKMTPSNSNTSYTAPLSKDQRFEMEERSESLENTPVEIPQRPFSAYIKVSIMCIMTAFGGFLFGWDIGSIGGFISQSDFLARFAQEQPDGTFKFSNNRVGWIVGILNIGCAIGGIVLCKSAEVWGRRKGLVFVTVFYMAGLIVEIASQQAWYQFFIGRFIEGLGIGGIVVISPMLISEVAPKHLRGSLVACFQLMITCGIFVADCTNYGCSEAYDDSRQWRINLGLGFAWALMMMSAMLFVPESPRYLTETGAIEEAKRSISISNRLDVSDPAVLAEVDEIQAGIDAERLAGSASWGELLKPDGKVLQRLIMGCCVMSMQQLTGANYFFFYGTVIFKAVGLENSFATSIIFGGVNFLSTFCALWCVENLGRRRTLLWGACGMATCMVIYATIAVTSLYPDGEDQPSNVTTGNAMIAFACIFIFFFATSWAPIPFVLVSESYPLRIKAKAMSVCQAFNWFWTFMIGFFTPFITDSIGFSYGYVFLGCLIVTWFYVYFFVPETKGLTLEEVNTMWLEGTLPWKSTQWVPPSRRDESYNVDSMANDDKPAYKKLFGK